MRDSRFDSAQIMICDIVDAYAVSDWMCNINFCNKLRKGDGFHPISIKKHVKRDGDKIFGFNILSLLIC